MRTAYEVRVNWHMRNLWVVDSIPNSQGHHGGLEEEVREKAHGDFRHDEERREGGECHGRAERSQSTGESRRQSRKFDAFSFGEPKCKEALPRPPPPRHPHLLLYCCVVAQVGIGAAGRAKPAEARKLRFLRYPRVRDYYTSRLCGRRSPRRPSQEPS